MFTEIKTRAWKGVVALVLFAMLSACERGSNPGDSGERRALVVFAASSMTEVLGQMERAFEERHPDVDVQLHFAGSQALRLQIEQGAPADLYVSANQRHADALATANLTLEPRVIAYNELVMITPHDNPARLSSFADLGKARHIVLGAPEVPVGIYTRALMERASEEMGAAFVDRVSGKIASREQNVRLVRAKVELGEADAAIVYKTDALASERVLMIELPKALQVRSTYTASVVGHPKSSGPADANAFLKTMLAPEGKQLLAEHGFLTELP